MNKQSLTIHVEKTADYRRAGVILLLLLAACAVYVFGSRTPRVAAQAQTQLPGRIFSITGNAYGHALYAYNSDAGATNSVYYTALKNNVYAEHPSVSAQTGMIAFTACGDFSLSSACGSNGANGQRIFVMNADGSNLRQLTTSAGLINAGIQTDVAPVISPDGAKIAFLRAVPNSTNSNGGFGYNTAREVFVINTDGSGLRQVTTKQENANVNYPYQSTTDSVAWSPDNSKLAVYGTRLYHMKSGNDVFTKTIFTVSPDGSAEKLLAVSSVISEADAQAGDLRFQFRGNGAALDWSPDNRRIVFAVEQGAYPNYKTGYVLINPNNTAERSVIDSDHLGGTGGADAAGSVRFSPDSQKLLYGLNDDDSIRTINLDGSASAILKTNESFWNDAKWWQPGAPLPAAASLVLTPNPVTVYLLPAGQQPLRVQLVPTVLDANGNVIVHVASYQNFYGAHPNAGVICDAQHPCSGSQVPLDVDSSGKLYVNANSSTHNGGAAMNVCASNFNVTGCTVVNVSLPTIGIVASAPTVNKSGAGGAGKFTINAKGNANTNFVVNFTVTGTAVRDVDYTLDVSGDSLTIPAGQSTTEIKVIPNPVSSWSGERTVVITLAPDSTDSFVLDSSASSASVTIKDDHVTPVDAPSVQSISPGKGGDKGFVTANVYGANLKPGATVKLTRAGQPDINGTTVIVKSNLYLTARFNLKEKAQGTYDVVIVNPDGKTATLPAAFTIEAGRSPVIRLGIGGQFISRRRLQTNLSGDPFGEMVEAYLNADLRVNRERTFYLQYRNTGNADAPATDITIAISRSLNVTDAPVSPNGAPAFRFDFDDAGVGSRYSGVGLRYNVYQVFLPGIPAGTSGSIPFRIYSGALHQGFGMRAVATYSEELQPIVDKPIDPTATLSADYTENTANSLKMTTHVRSAYGRTDIPVQITRTPTTEEKAPTVNITENNGILTIKYEATVPAPNSSNSNVNSVGSAGVHRTSGANVNTAEPSDAAQTAQELINVVAQLPGHIAPNGTVSQNYVSIFNNLLSTFNAAASSAERQQMNDYLVSEGLIDSNEANNLNNFATAAVPLNAINTLIAVPGSPVNAVAGAQFGALVGVMDGAWELRVWYLYHTDFEFASHFTDQNGNFLTKDELIKRLKKDALDAGQAETGLEGETLESGDPNEITGPIGRGLPGFITGTDPLSYGIYFENKPEATAPAQDVVITDQLDLSKVDAATFSFGFMTFGKTIVTPPPGLADYTTDVDLRPSNNLIVRIHAALDKTTGLITWKFASLDPATMRPTEDPRGGFLPPNKKSAEGQGSVTFNVAAKELSPGTEIRSKARIVFDANAPIDTNEWLNTIDNTKPVSRVTALDASQSSIVFNVNWTGMDTGSGIDRYTIYVSENGGAFTIWRDGTTATSGLFVGKPGKMYSFYSVARDKANNIESPKTTSEAMTTVVSSSLQNSLDDARFFVRQHYLDFLNREPDQGGFDYWTNLITKCAATDAKCINAQRVTVSAAFFIEQEFQDTGSFVYRFYKGSLGRQPKYAEFVSDRSGVIGGASLEASKATFADAWAQRAEFTAKYPLSLSPDSFVDALLQTVRQTSNVDLSGQRQTFINQLQAGGSRAQVIRAIVDAQAFQKAEYNRAFVLMQYFGYLRRDPDTGGYNFWLDILNNRVPNNYRSMVCAFITSAEYQLRFGSAVTRTDQVCGSIGQ